MTSCARCGKSQGPKCEGGEVRYLSGLFPCAKLVGHPTRDPDPWYDRPKPVARVIKTSTDDNLWTIEPEPSAEGLEDLL